MAVTVTGFTGAVWGIPTGSPELGFNCENFSVTVQPEIDEPIPGLDGQVRGFVSGDPMRDVKMSGDTQDITTSSSIFVTNFVTAFVPVNVVAYFGASAGGLYLKKGTVTRDRKKLRQVDVELKSYTNLA